MALVGTANNKIGDCHSIASPNSCSTADYLWSYDTCMECLIISSGLTLSSYRCMYSMTNELPWFLINGNKALWLIIRGIPLAHLLSTVCI